MPTAQIRQTRADPFTGSVYRAGLPPGLYEERAAPIRSQLVHLDTAAFIGLAERGPVNTPVAIGSMPMFRKIFGSALGDPLLPQAVGAFFANGGVKCIVVRVLDHVHARTAQFNLPGLTPATLVAARNPGAWANHLQVRTRLRRLTFPLRNAPPLDPAWIEGGLLAPAHRATPGVTLVLFGVPAPTSMLARIVAVAKPRRGVTAITLDPPLPAGFNQPELLAGAQELLARLEIALDGELVEVWDDAALHPDHPDFLPRVLGRRAESELLIAPRVDGSPERDRIWGGEDDPAGSSYVRPSLDLVNVALAPTQELMVAPDGVSFDTATLDAPESGDDATLTTTRATFFDPTPGDPTDTAGLRPFSGRPGALDALSVWDEANLVSPVALVCMPDLLHPTEPTSAPEVTVGDDTPCFGPCIHAVPVVAPSPLSYPNLGGTLEDLQLAQARVVQHCESVGGRIAVLDLPPNLQAGGIVGWHRALASDRAALVAPWFRAASVDDPLGATITLPPSSAVAGLIARVEQQTGVFASPGAQTIAGVFGLAQDPGLPEPGFLFAERINAIQLTEKGIQLMGSRTTSLDLDWTHINVRRTVDWIMAQLPLDLAWAPFEPNNTRLWSAMTQSATGRLRGLFDSGALAGDTPAQSYFVRCDLTTMTQSDLDNGRAIMLVGVAPAVPSEFVVFRLIREGGDTPGISLVP